MEGVNYIIDKNGHKKAIIIAMDKFGDYIEGIEDMLVAISRKSELRITLAEVEKKYDKQKNQSGK
nr:hypothetical protein [Bacteroidota bacterium]